jgi:hypothetical protein
MKCFKQFSMIMQCREQRLLSSFLNPNMGQLWVKISSIQAVPPQGTQTKKWRKSAKMSTKTVEAPFKRSLKGWGFHTMKYYEVKVFIIRILHQIINVW